MKDEVKCLGYRCMEGKPVIPISNTRAYSKIKEIFLRVWQCICLSRQPESTFLFLYLPALCSTNPALWSGKLDYYICISAKAGILSRGRLILQLPHSYSNTAACVALDIKSMHSVCTVRKLKISASGDDK